MAAVTLSQWTRRVRFRRSLTGWFYSPASRPASRAFAPGCALLAILLPFGGCSTVIPLPSLISDDDATGSIGKQASPLSASLDDEDWRRARAAMAVALDPQGNGAAVNWDNPKSGMKGSFTPVGEARPSDEKICRAFLADIGGAAPARTLQGVACREKNGDWSVSDVKPWKKS